MALPRINERLSGRMRATDALAAGLLVLLATGSLWLTAGKSQPPVIAILPFRNLSVEPDSEYFVDGLTDEVIRNLSVLDGLTVRSSYSSFTFKNKPRDVPDVARQLNANYVLDASVLRWPGAEKAFQRAIELNPGLTSTYTIYVVSTLRPLGKHNEALRLLRVALENDPRSLNLQREIGMAQQEAGQYEDAIETLQRVRDVDPDLPFVDEALARALTLAGRPAEALPAFERSEQGMGRPRRNPGLALAYVLGGRRAEAEAVAAEHGNGDPYALAMIYAALGDKDRAFEALERLAVVKPHRVPRLLVKPELAGLRGDSRLTALRKRFNLP